MESRFYLLPDDGEALGSDIQQCTAEEGCTPRLTQRGAGNLIRAVCELPEGGAKQGFFELPRGGRALALFTSGCAMDGGDLTIENLQLTP